MGAEKGSSFAELQWVRRAPTAGEQGSVHRARHERAEARLTPHAGTRRSGVRPVHWRSALVTILMSTVGASSAFTMMKRCPSPATP